MVKKPVTSRCWLAMELLAVTIFVATVTVVVQTLWWDSHGTGFISRQRKSR